MYRGPHSRPAAAAEELQPAPPALLHGRSARDRLELEHNRVRGGCGRDVYVYAVVDCAVTGASGVLRVP